MTAPHTGKKIIVRTLMLGGVAVAGFALTPGTAQERPAPAPLARWSPGLALADSTAALKREWRRSGRLLSSTLAARAMRTVAEPERSRA